MTKWDNHVKVQAEKFAKVKENHPLDMLPDLREALKAELTHHMYSDIPPAVPLSGGMDSQVILFSLLDLGVKPITYTFCLEGHESRDLRYAKATAKEFGVEHRTLWLKKDPDQIMKYVRYMLHETKNPSKSFMCCLWPQLTLLKRIKRDGLRHMIIGLASDWYYASSRKWGQMAKALNIPMDEIVIRTFRNIDEQVLTLRCEAMTMGMTVEVPHSSSVVLARMLGSKRTYNDVNKPRQKELLRRCFEPELLRTTVGAQAPFNCGDSGINEYFDSVVLNSVINTKGYKNAGAVLKYALDNPSVFDGADPSKSRLNKRRI